MKSATRRFLAIGLGVGLILLCSTAPGASGQTPAPEAGYETLDSFPRTPTLPGELYDVMGALALLADENPDSITSVRLASASDVVIEGIDPGVEALARQIIAEHGFDGRLEVAFVPREFSHQDLMDQQRSVVEKNTWLKEHMVIAGVDPEKYGVIFQVDALEPKQAATVADQIPAPVRFVVELDKPLSEGQDANSRGIDEAPYNGGFRYGISQTGNESTYQGYCSGGFGVLLSSGDDMALTAGHCYPSGTTNDEMYVFTAAGGTVNFLEHAGHFYGSKSSMNSAGSSIKVGPDNDYHGDVAEVNVSSQGNATTKSIWVGGWNTTTTDPVIGRSAPSSGQALCLGGATSGQICGLQIVATNTDFTYGSGATVRNIDIAQGSNCSTGGDSGGSIYYSNISDEITAVGIVSGHYTQATYCYQILTGTEEAFQAWGGTLKQH